VSEVNISLVEPVPIVVSVSEPVVEAFIVEAEPTMVATVRDLGPRGPSGIPTDAYVYFDAGGDVDAARPSEPPGVNFVWDNVPGRPTNIGPKDQWVDLS
jgi:hypothetical protein